MHNEKFFVPDLNYDQEGFDVLTILGKHPTKGEIGIEIECEGNKFPKQNNLLPPLWNYTHDGSLRGKDNAEYVLKSPIAFKEVKDAVFDLYKTLADYGTVLDDSNRTSVHVHLNVQTFHLPRLTSFLALYFSLEEILTEWCGDHRVGNLFCLRAKDAPAIVSKIKKWIVNDGRTELTEGLHYSGMNTQALIKFGSLEIRSLRGVTDPGTVVQWVGVLERIYNLSAEYPDPRGITENFSGNDPIDYLRGVLGEHYDTVRASVSMNDDAIRQSMYEGIRLAQDLCYCRDWSRYKPVTRSTDPFGRNKKKMSPLQQAYANIGAPMPSHMIYDEAQYISPTLNTAWAQAAAQVPTPTPWLNPFAETPPEEEEVEDDYEPEEDYDPDEEE